MSTLRRLLNVGSGWKRDTTEGEWVLVEHRNPPKQGSAKPKQEAQPAQASNVFLHAALPSALHFRLLKLLPGNGLEGIVCSLHPFDIRSEHLPTYRAISYTWGTGEAKHAICIAEQTFLVRGNLRDLLRCVRLPDYECWLWVDALCIDQNSDGERNHQVRLMGKIYERAVMVVAWLLSTHEVDVKPIDVEYALRFMASAASRYRAGQTLAAYCEETDPTAVDGTRPYNGLCTWEDQWKCFAVFCRLQYWTRKWIIQEVILAPTVVLQAGRTQIAMTTAEDFFAPLHSNPYRNIYNICSSKQPSERDKDDKREIDRYYRWESEFGKSDFSSTQVAILARHRLGRRSGKDYPQSLHELLPRYERHDCKVSSDHVYALFNLIGDHRQHLQVDYSQEPLNRCRDILAFMQQYDGLSPVDMVAMTILLIRKLELHSVPNIQNALRAIQNHAMASMIVKVFDRGKVMLSEESTKTISIRNKVPALCPMPTCGLAMVDEHWEIQTNKEYNHDINGHSVSPYDLVCHKAVDTSLFGLAATRVRDGDRIWQFQQTNVAFVMRPWADDGIMIVGRTLLWSNESQQVERDRLGLDVGCFVKSALCEKGVSGGTDGPFQHEIRLSFADLIELAFWAHSVGPTMNPFTL